MKLLSARLALIVLAAAMLGGSLALTVLRAQQSTISDRVLSAEFRQGELDRTMARLVTQINNQADQIRDLQNQEATLRGLGMAFGALVFLVQGFQVVWGRRNKDAA